MKFLIAMKGKQTSGQTLQFGAMIASRLGTDISVLYVEQGGRQSMSQELQMARQKMQEWQMKSTGYEVLSYACNHLTSMGLIKGSPGDDAALKAMTAEGLNSVKLQGCVPGVKSVTFRYREGDVLEEILNEMYEHNHELLVIGTGEDSDFLIRLLKFYPKSILIVKNVRDIRYRLLVATDASPPAHRAELLAIKTASFLKLEITFLTVAKTDKEKQFMEKHLTRMTGVCKLKKVPYKVITSEGDVIRETTEIAGDDHIIVLGRSRRGALKKLFMGSKAISTVSSARCPLLLVK